MQITTTTIQGKTSLEIEALIREAYQAGEREFTTDLPADIFNPSSIGSTQWDADGTPCTDWGFNVGEWDMVADTETLGEVPARVNEKREVITMEEHWVRCFEQGQHTNHAQDSFYNFVKYSGLSIKKLTANTWQDQDPKTLTLPFRFVRLFDLIDGEMTLTAIGIF